MKKRKTHSLIKSAALLVASVVACHGQMYVTAQFDLKASLEGKSNFGFEISTNGTAQLSSPQKHTLCFNTNDWAVIHGNLANEIGSQAAGLRLEPEGEYDAANVRAGVMVVRVQSYQSRATFLSSEFLVRLTSRLHGSQKGVWDSMFAAQNVRVWVNQVENKTLPTNEWVVVSFLLPEAVKLNGHAVGAEPGADSRIMLMGDTGLLEWGRAVDGSLTAAVLLGGDGEMDEIENILRGIEHGLALRYAIRGIRPASATQVSTCRSAGYFSFNAWSTLLLLR